MSYPKKLLRLRPTKGIVSDTPSHEVGPEFYTAGQNVIFRNGFASRVRGFRSAYTTALAAAAPGDILHTLNAQFNDTNYWLIFEADGTAWSLTGTTAVEIDALLLSAVTQPWQYSSALLNGVPIVASGLDELMYWDGTEMVLLPDWETDASAKSIAVFKYHIFAMDVSNAAGSFPNLVMWSDAAEPGTIPDSWTPGAGNEAGSVELADGPGPVLCARPLRDNLIFYKRSTVYGAQYVGGNQKYSFQKLSASHGTLTRHSVCDIGGTHFVVEQGDIVLTDGTNRQSVGQARMKDFLFGQLDQDSYENLFCTFNRAKNEVLVAFPSAGSTRCNLALVYDVANDAFGIRDLPDIACAAVGTISDTAPSDFWDDDSGAWDDDDTPWGSSAIAAATESLVFAYDDVLEEQDTSDAQTVPASIGKYDLHFGEPERVKFVRRLHVRAKEGFGTLLVRVGARMTPTDDITWSDEVALTEPEQIVNAFAQGRYISVEARSNSTRVWTVTGIDIEAELRGYH
ncbi:MAG: hypothetical protein WD795_16360 [Woeseia sp.]